MMLIFPRETATVLIATSCAKSKITVSSSLYSKEVFSMDVIFQTENGAHFTIEVGFFDTVLEIKEKVEKYQGIPVSKQTLYFNGRILEDRHDIEYCEILHNSILQLHISPSSGSSSNQSDRPPQIKIETPMSTDVHLRFDMPFTKIALPDLDMDVSDTILSVKEKIHEIVKCVPVDRLIIRSNGAELQDGKSLWDCQLMDYSKVDVNIKMLSTSSSRILTMPNNRRLILWVMTACGSKKMLVEMNPSANVGELRRELQNLNQVHHFIVPQEEYFFIYKEIVMDEDRSFQWHRVCQGDTIEIFKGSLAAGGS